MQTIVFIGTNKSGSSRDAFQIAERLGYLTVLLTNRPKHLEQRTEFPDVHEMVFSDFTKEDVFHCISELEKQGKQIVGIISFIDPYVHFASELSDERGLPSFSTEAIRQMENKIDTHKALNEEVTSYFDVYDPEISPDRFVNKFNKKGKWIVKPPESTGSKDIILADDLPSLKKAISRLSRKFRNKPLLVEEYLDGPQYLVEVLVVSGTAHIVAIIKQDFFNERSFVVTGYSLLANLEEDFYRGLQEVVSSIVDSFKMENGACHLELRLVEGKWKLVEINPRISGSGMNAMIEAAYGINLVEETLRLYLGQSPDLTKKRSLDVYAHYLTIDSWGRLLKVTGRNRALQHTGVEKIYIKPRKGAIMRTPASMGNRYGYVIATGENPEQAKEMARTSASEIRFHLEPVSNKGGES